MGYNTIHPSDSERTQKRIQDRIQKRKKEEEKLCSYCRVYTCICFTAMMLVYVIVGVTIYLVEDFSYDARYDYPEDGSS